MDGIFNRDLLFVSQVKAAQNANLSTLESALEYLSSIYLLHYSTARATLFLRECKKTLHFLLRNGKGRKRLLSMFSGGLSLWCDRILCFELHLFAQLICHVSSGDDQMT